jgi:hypothetical protein
VPFSGARASAAGNSSGSSSDPRGEETFSPNPCPDGSVSVDLLQIPNEKISNCHKQLMLVRKEFKKGHFVMGKHITTAILCAY